jgi:hypothetical protein
LIEDTIIQNARKMYAVAKEKIKSANVLIKSGMYNDALSRAYYGAFHSVSLLFFIAGQSFSSHSQLIGNFNKQYIATGKLQRDLGKALSSLYDDRQGADYDFFQQYTETDAKSGIRQAENIISAVKAYILEEYSIHL